MSIYIQPYLTDRQEEMEGLGLPEEVSEQAYLMAREALLAATIDARELVETALRYQRMLSESDRA